VGQSLFGKDKRAQLPISVPGLKSYEARVPTCSHRRVPSPLPLLLLLLLLLKQIRARARGEREGGGSGIKVALARSKFDRSWGINGPASARKIALSHNRIREEGGGGPGGGNHCANYGPSNRTNELTRHIDPLSRQRESVRRDQVNALRAASPTRGEATKIVGANPDRNSK